MKAHLSHAFDKLDVHDRVELALHALAAPASSGCTSVTDERESTGRRLPQKL